MDSADAVKRVRGAGDAFAVFGLGRAFEVDAAELERRYGELTRATHPDLAGDDAEKQIEAMDLSAKVNEAHRVLGDPEARGNLLLELMGGPTKEGDRSLPEGFLPIIMMVREELAEAQLEGDAERVKGIEADARAQREARLREIGKLFQSEINGGTLKSIRMELNALRYYERLLEQVNGEERGM